MKNNTAKRLIPSLISVSIFLMLASLTFSLYNRQVMLKNTEIKQKSELIKETTADLHFRGVKSSDLTLRGYALVQSEHYQQMHIVRKITQQNLDTLERLLKSEGYQLTQFYAVKDAILKYYDFQEYMMQLAEAGEMDKFKTFFEEDRGDKLWNFYNEFVQIVNKKENKKLEQAQTAYQQALNGNILVQIFLVGIGVPTLLLVLIWLHREQKARRKLLMNLQNNNQEYLFDDGNLMSEEEITDKAMITETVRNLKEAARFVQQLTKGNYQVEWQGWEEVKRLEFNQQNLAGALQDMKERLQKLKTQHEQRNWVNQGLNTLSEIIRTYQEEPRELLQNGLSFLARYLEAYKGAIYLNKKNTSAIQEELELLAAFGLDARQLTQKCFAAGEGLAGQVFQEGKSKIIDKLPSDYFKITSGLGQTAVAQLILVPLKRNDKSNGVLELASLENFEPYELDFLEKAAEYLGSAIAFYLSTKQATTEQDFDH